MSWVSPERGEEVVALQATLQRVADAVNGLTCHEALVALLEISALVVIKATSGECPTCSDKDAVVGYLASAIEARASLKDAPAS